MAFCQVWSMEHKVNNAITVSQYSQYIKQIFEAEELLHNIRIVGEVFGISLSRSVTYFSLKDDMNAISCVSFVSSIFDDIKEGDKVTITGSPNYYMKSGKLSFNVTKIEKEGQGDLFKKFMQLKEQLSKEGLFDEEHKKPIPANIKRIGVITSKEGAVIHDIINVSHRRDAGVDILLFPVKVQGIGAENEIARAINILSNYDGIDVVIVARGGGSLEDLWAYNTEIVARATYECQKPIVSAVGHETDFTIIDFVSDLRAPTPSAAAEILTIEKKSLKSRVVADIDDFIFKSQRFFEQLKFQVDNMRDSLYLQGQSFVRAKEYELGLLDSSLAKLDPMAILKRGYAKLEQNKKNIDSVRGIELKSNLDIFLVDGQITAKPIEIKEEVWISKRQSKNLKI